MSSQYAYDYVCENLHNVEEFAWWLAVHNPDLLKQIVIALKNKNEDE